MSKQNEVKDKDFSEYFREAYNNFAKWTILSSLIMKLRNGFKNIKELDGALTYTKNENIMIEENSSIGTNSNIDTIEIDLKDAGIDVSKWEDDVKPVKIIMSVLYPETKEFKARFDIKDMILLMEDGTFRINK